MILLIFTGIAPFKFFRNVIPDFLPAARALAACHSEKSNRVSNRFLRERERERNGVRVHAVIGTGTFFEGYSLGSLVELS